jgi:CRISPR/Cas system endoribonuclease Cas6 (RAMP superfamily)
MQQASLDLQGNGTMPFLGSDISPLALSVENVDQNILRVKIGANGRFEVPPSLFRNTGEGEQLPRQSPLFTSSALATGLWL